MAYVDNQRFKGSFSTEWVGVWFFFVKVRPSPASRVQDIADRSRESPNEPYGCLGRLQGKHMFRESCEP